MQNLKETAPIHGLVVLHEDANLFAIIKPALIHSVELPRLGDVAQDEDEGGEADSKSVAGLLLAGLPELGGVAPQTGDAGLVQRLDFETSGVLVGAKNKETWNRIREAFKQGLAEKRYLVVLEGRLESQISIDAPIGSPYRRASKVRAYVAGKKQAGRERAQPAESHFTSLVRDPHGAWTLAEVEASTGRRHQVRVHAAALGHPLLGDALYGSKGNLLNPGEGIPPFALHAASLKIAGVGAFEAPTPPYFAPYLGKGR
jgi:23S rRNA pseudouridine1911/1915/1917 synthase